MKPKVASTKNYSLDEGCKPEYVRLHISCSSGWPRSYPAGHMTFSGHEKTHTARRTHCFEHKNLHIMSLSLPGCQSARPGYPHLLHLSRSTTVGVFTQTTRVIKYRGQASTSKKRPVWPEDLKAQSREKTHTQLKLQTQQYNLLWFLSCLRFHYQIFLTSTREKHWINPLDSFQLLRVFALGAAS